MFNERWFDAGGLCLGLAGPAWFAARAVEELFRHGAHTVARLDRYIATRMETNLTIEGTIVGRRVLGKHLAFATKQLAGDEEQLVKVQFRRLAGNSTDGTHSVWAADSEAPFPVRKSLLQLASQVSVDVVQRSDDDAQPSGVWGGPEVVRWRVIASSAGPVSARGAFSVPQRLQERERAHRDAMAVVTGAAAEVLPLCKHWMLTGSCQKHTAG